MHIISKLNPAYNLSSARLRRKDIVPSEISELLVAVESSAAGWLKDDRPFLLIQAQADARPTFISLKICCGMIAFGMGL